MNEMETLVKIERQVSVGKDLKETSFYHSTMAAIVKDGDVVDEGKDATSG
jgi:hypothetical protein